jgi:hypothetical protein
MSQTTMPPILSHKHYSAGSTFTPESLLREARRQKGLPSAAVGDFEKGTADGAEESLHVISLAAGRWREESDALRA